MVCNLRRHMKESSSKKKQKRRGYELIVGILLFVLAIVLIIIFFVKGQVTVTGDFPDNEKTVSATCTSSTIGYPFFANNEAAKKDMSIKIVANEDKVDTLSLLYYLYYGSEDAITSSRDVNHYAVNKAFEEAGLEADALGANYSRLADSFKFTLFAKAPDLNSTTVKFFLLDGIKIEDGIKYSTTKSMYKALGFKCTENNVDKK